MPAAAPVRIRIGAALDVSVDQTFAAFEKRAKRAADNDERATKVRHASGPNFAKSEADQKIREEKRAAKEVEALWKQSSRAQLQEIRRLARERNREHKQLLAEVAREERKAAREAEQLARRVAREKAKAEKDAARAAKNSARELDRFATRTSHRATRFLMPNAPLASMARRGALDIARGYGIETGLSGAFQRGIGLESRATQLAQAAYMPAAGGAASKLQDPKKLIAEVQAIGDKLAMPYEDAMGALEAFVTKTGDLATGRSILEDMAKLAGATGTNLGDMVDAAADVSNALGDIPDKGKAIDAVMRQIAAGGKVGAVEIKDLAKYMARLSAASGSFGGDRAETIVKLGALTQLSRAKGGAASAAEAARSISGLANTLQTPARRAKFREYGVNIEDEMGLLRDPLEILKESIAKTGGKTEPLKEMWANVIGAKPAQALSTAYKQAGGGDAGMRAVQKELDTFLKSAALSQKQIDDANKARLGTDAAKVQQFNNELEKVADGIRADLAPTLAELTPKILESVRAFGSLVQWMTKNPGLTISAAISASIARAGLESALRTGIERVINSAAQGLGAGPAGPGVGAAGGMGAIGKLSAALTITALAATVYISGRAAIDWGFDTFEKKQEQLRGEERQRETAISTAERNQRESKGKITEEDKKRLEEGKRKGEAQLSRATDSSGFMGRAFGAASAGPGGAIFAGAEGLWKLAKGAVGAEGGMGPQQMIEMFAVANSTKFDELRAELNQVQQLLRAPLQVKREVAVSNLKGGGSEVDPRGRE